MTDPLIGSLMSGWDTLLAYLMQHVITCLVPAFFIAGGIAAFLKKDAILRYFSADTKKYISYGIASVSGAVLAVCSCTILPMFAGILKKGAGIGPAFTFLFAGPAINILAIVYTANVLGLDLGIARAFSAVVLSIIVGLLMATIFRSYDEERHKSLKAAPKPSGVCEEEKSNWVVFTFFVLMIGILLVATSQLDWLIRLSIIYFLTLGVAYLLIYYFTRTEVTDWGLETWDLTKKIFPILIIGTFALGVLAYFLPPSTFRPYMGENTLLSSFIAAVIGAILYMPTLLEVPIIGTTLGYLTGDMAKGPALALLLSGPTISLPSILVLYRIIGARKTMAYTAMVVIFATLAGYIFGISGL